MRESAEEYDISKCQVCGRPSTVHLTEVWGKRKRQKHLCDEHAEAAGLPIGTKEQRAAAFEKMAVELRREQYFIRRHGRLPLRGEDIFENTSDPHEAGSGEINDPLLLKQLENLDQMAVYLEAQAEIPAGLDETATLTPGMTGGLDSMGMNVSTPHIQAGGLNRRWGWNIRIGWILWMMSIFVAANADAIAIIVGFGKDAYFVQGLRVANWKHGILSNGQPIPGRLEVLRIALGFFLWQVWNVSAFLLMKRIEG